MASHANKAILVVDDDPVLRSGVARELVDRGFDVRTAANGNEALQAERVGRFDVVLLDVELPGRGADEVLAALRASPRTTRTRFVLLVETGDSASLDRALRHGADGVIHKDRMTSRELALEVSMLFEGGGQYDSGESRRGGGSRVDAPVWADSDRSRPADAVDVFQTRELIETRDASQTTAASKRRFGPRARPTSIKGKLVVDGDRAKSTEGTRSVTMELGAPMAVRRERSATRDITPPHTAEIFEPATNEVLPVVREIEPAEAAPAFDDMARGLATDAQLMETGEIRLSQTGEIHLRAPPPRAPGRGFGNPEHDVYAGVVNPLIGGVARLAEALGLPGNLTCPTCKVQILLHMSIDDVGTRTVKGHFACPKCGSR